MEKTASDKQISEEAMAKLRLKLEEFTPSLLSLFKSPEIVSRLEDYVKLLVAAIKEPNLMHARMALGQMLSTADKNKEAAKDPAKISEQIRLLVNPMFEAVVSAVGRKMVASASLRRRLARVRSSVRKLAGLRDLVGAL